MANVAQIHQVAPFASTAVQQLEQLEAMFHAIRSELDTDCYAYQLANLGQEIASGYAATMQKIAMSGVHHG
ncbi:hypothetical protein WM11_31515 [Burkholderia ubonensis]|uniref:hypothetical protein n=1 Tax=Burkholderia ubonensis TaxID=101571 RepID=UPI00075EB4F9|nr:hypothetical protein [Burkholderia ubonensis]KVR46387.1 hypothetical protein WK18_12735 [Burkholderia ubonensis]KVU21228.1 hypothetical protein WK62_19790 [Burkholderia ubonensis]KWB74511.1 hypothetical protein WL41_15265 [Burkholderia ubonensis]KWC20043.1 hypothetical protein WL46_21965 [Burkholderia ubonensis]KWK12952.1 hypothetical protein WM11_31515 [Burkholderia ubonensis]